MFRTILFKPFLSLLVMGSFVYAHAQDVTIDGTHFVKKEGIWYQRENDRDFRVGNEITIRFKQMPDGTEALQSFSNPKNLTLIRKNRLGYFDFRLPPSADPIEVLSECKNDINVEFASLGTEIIFLSPNDTYFQDQWTLSKIQIEDAWNIITGSSSVIISIIDDGIHVSHDDLSGNIWQNDDPVNGNDDDENGMVDDINGWNFHENSNQLNIDSGDPVILTDHGTACAGIVAAATNNGEGIAGVAGGWNGNGCKIMGVRVLSSTQLDDAILYAADEGTDIISMSFGSPSSSAINAAIEDAYNDGVILIAAAGNDNTQVSYPASNQYVFAVGATDDNDDRWNYSNYGSNLDVMAPSGDVNLAGILYSTDGPGNVGYNPNQTTNDLADLDYTKYFGGTSGACPHVSGLAALLKSADGSLNPPQIMDIIRYTADDLGSSGWDQYYGWGRINAYNAVRSADRQFTTSGTLTYNQCWWGTISLSNNVYVPNGKVLGIANGATINLNGYYIKCTGSGKILRGSNVTFNLKDISVKSGSTLKGQYSAVQQAIDNANSNQTVYLADDTYTEDLNMKPNVWVEGASENSTAINGKVNFNNDNSAGLWSVKVNKKISVNNSDYADIGIKAGTSNCYIDISGSWVYVEMTSTVSGSRGIYAHNGSYLDFMGGSITHKSLGVDLYLNTDAFLEGAYFCQNNMDISAGSGYYAETMDCEFSSSTEGGSVEGDVYWEDWSWCGSSKQLALQSNTTLGKTNVTSNSIDSGLSDYWEAMRILRTIRKNLRQDKKSGELLDLQKYAAEFARAIGKFKQVVANYPGSSHALSSLGRIAVAYRVLNEFETLAVYMQEIANNPELNNLKPYALNALLPCYIKQKEYEKAITLSNQIIEEFPEHEMIVELIYGKGLLYKYHLT